MSCGKVKQNTLTDTFRKKIRRKTAKKKKRKRTAFSVWRRWPVKVLQEKIMPAGRHFRWSNGAAA